MTKISSSTLLAGTSFLWVDRGTTFPEYARGVGYHRKLTTTWFFFGGHDNL